MFELLLGVAFAAESGELIEPHHPDHVFSGVAGLMAGEKGSGALVGAKGEMGLGWADLAVGFGPSPINAQLAGGAHFFPLDMGRGSAFGRALRLRGGLDVVAADDHDVMADVGVGVTLSAGYYLDGWAGVGPYRGELASRYRVAVGYGLRLPKSQFSICGVIETVADDLAVAGVAVSYGRRVATGPNWENTRRRLLEEG